MKMKFVINSIFNEQEIAHSQYNLKFHFLQFSLEMINQQIVLKTFEFSRWCPRDVGEESASHPTSRFALKRECLKS